MISIPFVGRRRAVFAAVALASVGSLATPAVAQETSPDPGVYSFEVTLSPACLNGTFPIRLTTDAGPLDGEMTVATDERGRVTGTLDLGEETFAVNGRARANRRGYRVTLTARAGRNRLTFSGSFFIGSFTGTVRGRGDVARGRNTFDLDVGAAPPQTAFLQASLEDLRRGRMGGEGAVTVCGTRLETSVNAVAGRRFRLTIRAKGFHFSGSGSVLPGGTILKWSARGFGATARGEGLRLDVLPPPAQIAYADLVIEYEAEDPVVPNQVTEGADPFNRYSVSPALPPGMTISAATGAIGGTPAGTAPSNTYTVTAANAAGESTTDVTISVRINRFRSLVPEARELSDDDLRHFLTRTHFGVEAVTLARLKSIGLDQFIDEMLVMQQGTPWEAEAYPQLVNVGDPPGFEAGFPSRTDVARWWQVLMVQSETPFQESLAFFWHDHFALSSEVLGTPGLYWMPQYVNLLRYEGTGNLRDLLVSIARDNAMLIYLDGYRNTASAPNENFAREFWELFTLGVDNGYTQEDIVEASRAFTGYRLRLNAETNQWYMEFVPSRHDEGEKVILGQTIEAQEAGDAETDDFEAVADITLAHRDVAEFICRKLFAWFGHPEPAPEVVADMATVLRDGNYEIAPLLRAMFRSEAFFSSRARRSGVKGPADFGIGFVRSTGLEFGIAQLDTALTSQGQRPTMPPTVDGWPTGSRWLSSQAALERTNLVRDSIYAVGTQASLGVQITDLLPPEGQRTPAAVVDALADRLYIDLSAEDRVDLIAFLNTTRTEGGVVVASAFDEDDAPLVEGRVRDLLYILAQHPTYHVK